METQSIKEQAHRLLDSLPDSATWEDLMYRIYVRQAIEAGIKDSDEGRTVDVKKSVKDSGCRNEGTLDEEHRQPPGQHLRIHCHKLPRFNQGITCCAMPGELPASARDW